jgi:hypothetical protein
MSFGVEHVRQGLKDKKCTSYDKGAISLEMLDSHLLLSKIIKYLLKKNKIFIFTYIASFRVLSSLVLYIDASFFFIDFCLVNFHGLPIKLLLANELLNLPDVLCGRIS